MHLCITLADLLKVARTPTCKKGKSQASQMK